MLLCLEDLLLKVWQRLIAAVYVSINLCINTVQALHVGLIKCVVHPIKPSSSFFLHKTGALSSLQVSFQGITQSWSVSSVVSVGVEHRPKGKMRLMIFCFMSLALVLSWRGGMFSIWSPRQQRSPTLKSLAGTSMQQDTMFTIGTIKHACNTNMWRYHWD